MKYLDRFENIDQTIFWYGHFAGPMPLLIDLLTKDDSDDELNERRWDLLAWMLSISKKYRDRLRTIDKELRVSCATLLALVQV